MRDLNFFKDYKGGKQEKIKQSKFLYIVIGIWVAIIVITLGYNSFNILRYKSKYKHYNEQLNSESVTKKLKKVEEVENKISVLKVYDTNLSEVTMAVDRRDDVSKDIIEKIRKCGTENMECSKISIQEGVVTVEVTGSSRNDIATLQYNLKKLGIFNDVHVNEVKEDSGKFTSSVKAVIKVVDDNENK
ncbi:hypothetical protein KQI30_14090 [Clostridium bornimense]|uniref:hypothetical protein n=1 Tax=Clostridium bornimense TaxID=1216932 RepID=UPI001C0FB1CD|nr:hypothetical protein [Clostridium bornimense]MBU5317383.1 hypothetical protein [Clostridium bornimense]